MILGTGIDHCDIKRIAQTLERYQTRFTHRLFTESEQYRAERRPFKRAARYAQFFAAKEACAKALGTGFRQGVFWRDIECWSLPSGKPMLRLAGGAAKKLDSLTPDDLCPAIDISLTDENGIAAAMVIITALPEDLAKKKPDWHQ